MAPIRPNIRKPGTIASIIDEARIRQALAAARHATPGQALALVRRALDRKGLSVDETAVLLTQGTHPRVLPKLLEAAGKVKTAIYGERLVFFAPLYISNVCSNDCLYCAYRRSNRALKRQTLTLEAIAEQVGALEDQGHKRLLLVAGESKDFGRILQSLKTIYATRQAQGEIRRVNVNLAPPTVEQFRQLKRVGIGTYQCFQETYHRETYQRMHPSGPKSDYAWRLTVMDRAVQAGIGDFSLGVLLGLYDFRFDVAAMVMHAHYLDRRYHIGPHAVSVPRLKVAKGTPLCDDRTLAGNRYRLTDRQFMVVVAVLRLALPYAGLILSTRERPALRRKLLRAGVSQLSAGSHTEVGGYAKPVRSPKGQFEIEDFRPLDTVIRDVIKAGQIPSFCTACYRCGRTGETIMDLLKPGTIKSFCFPNALLTFEEYLQDYASARTRNLGRPFLEAQLRKLPVQVRRRTISKLARIRAGERDLFF